MPDASATARAAQALFDQHQERRPLRDLPAGLAPATMADAYLVQDRLQRLYTAVGAGALAGWKIALTTPVMQQMVGVDHPCEGGIFASRVHRSPARIRAADYQHLGVEAEIAVRIGADADAAGAPYDASGIGAKVAACMAAIEIVDDHACIYGELDALHLVAANAFNFGCVLGPEVTGWRGLDLAALAGEMRINGRVAGTGRGADVMGHPFAALAWLADSLLARGRMLRAGDVVLMGSVVRTQWPEPGDEVVSAIEGLGKAVLRVE